MTSVHYSHTIWTHWLASDGLAESLDPVAERCSVEPQLTDTVVCGYYSLFLFYEKGRIQTFEPISSTVKKVKLRRVEFLVKLPAQS